VRSPSAWTWKSGSEGSSPAEVDDRGSVVGSQPVASPFHRSARTPGRFRLVFRDQRWDFRELHLGRLRILSVTGLRDRLSRPRRPADASGSLSRNARMEGVSGSLSSRPAFPSPTSAVASDSRHDTRLSPPRINVTHDLRRRVSNESTPMRASVCRADVELGSTLDTRTRKSLR